MAKKNIVPTTDSRRMDCMSFRQVISLVETNHEKALEAIDNYPEAITDIIEIAPEKAIEIAEANPDEILNIAGELARNKEFKTVMDLVEKFPNYAKRILIFNEKYGIDPLKTFLKVEDNNTRIAIARTHLELLDEFVSACPEFKEVASLLFVPKGKRNKTISP
ncbi:hypothetical protein KAS31_03640 [Candidatus Parcubacteria bacterium]|nr:hypothetical protein [Candidatus Parcubacteria bacterium]